ncbi:MAG: hypothetical protein IT379_37870 [Deltaproteobacteria bacterium]|nr:hypothetical protein [Deltaproteobacteria bacterium]
MTNDRSCGVALRARLLAWDMTPSARPLIYGHEGYATTTARSTRARALWPRLRRGEECGPSGQVPICSPTAS